MKSLRWLTAIILVLSLAFISPLQAFAADETKYISEISIGYGDEGKTALENEGFTVWQNLNANEGGNGSAVWIGYKTTTDAKEAITDIALMNMKGGYSFDAYTKEIEDLNKRVSEQLSSFKAAIAEFRKNYNDGNPFAAQAKKIMNGFTDDESNNKGIGDIFLDENTSEETLHRIFLEGNSEAIAAIETSLAIACIETGEENVITRISESEYPETLNPELNAARSALASAFEGFHSSALSIKSFIEEIESYEDGAEAFLNRETLSDADKATYLIQLSYYVLLSETPFGNTGMSIFDFALLDDEIENENGEVLEDEYLEMLAESMTEGQLGIVANVGIMSILTNAAGGAKADEAEAAYAEATEDITDTVSVYYEVDRSLFKDIDSIALTSKALRDKAAAEQNNFGKDPNAELAKRIILTSVAGAATIGGIVATVLGIRDIVLTYKASLQVFGPNYTNAGLIQQAIYGEVFGASNTVSSAITVSGIIATAIGVIAIIVGVVLLVYMILQWVEKPEVPHTVYTQIPRVIVERPDGQKDFLAYYAAKLAGAPENETDSTKLYGDLNALNDMDEWVALYYTKNTSVGSPITPEMIISNDGILNVSEEKKYTAVHMFGSNAAANLNQYNTNTSAKSIYLFFRTESTSQSQSGSLFIEHTDNGNSILINVISFIVGAGIAAAATYCIMRKKKTQA